jgi:TIGR03009 family protein
MPRARLILAAVFAAAPALAQAPPAPQVDPKAAPYLAGWEQVMVGAASFSCKSVELVRQNAVLRTEKTYTGEVACLKPGMAYLKLVRKPTPGAKPDPNDFTVYVSTGQAIYEYDGTARLVTELKPAAAGKNNLLLDLLAGAIRPGDVGRRFDVKLVGEDTTYVYLEFGARQPEDKAEFQTLTLALFKPGGRVAAFLPAQVRVLKPNGQEIEDWKFTDPKVNDDGLKAANFFFVQPPPGWKFQKAPGTTPAGR